MFTSRIAATIFLLVTVAFAQGTSPVTVPGRGPIATSSHTLADRGNPRGGVPAVSTLPQRIEDMQGTLTKMHSVLKQMRATLAKNHAKDPIVKGNLDMWELLVGNLEKQLQELQATQAARQDMEARRAALYKQADDKAAAEAQAARAAQAARFANSGGAPTPTPTAPVAGQSPAGQNSRGPSSPTPPANESPSPH